MSIQFNKAGMCSFFHNRIKWPGQKKVFFGWDGRVLTHRTSIPHEMNHPQSFPLPNLVASPRNLPKHCLVGQRARQTVCWRGKPKNHTHWRFVVCGWRDGVRDKTLVCGKLESARVAKMQPQPRWDAGVYATVTGWNCKDGKYAGYESYLCLDSVWDTTVKTWIFIYPSVRSNTSVHVSHLHVPVWKSLFTAPAPHLDAGKWWVARRGGSLQSWTNELSGLRLL